MDWLLQKLDGQWRVILNAPLAFTAAVVLVGGVIWILLDWRYSGIVEFQKVKLDAYRAKTGTNTPEDAANKIGDLEAKIKRLKVETDATVRFSKPDWKPQQDGSYLVISTMTINAATPRSGLTIGITTNQFRGFRVLASTEPNLRYGPYQNPKALIYLGRDRFHFRNVNGAYVIEINVNDTSPIVIRHEIEGKQEGKVVTWISPSSQ